MAKYRVLSADELHVLKKEFIDFLVVNGITSDEWEQIKKDNIEKANKTVELFSNVILEGSLRKIKYLKKVENENLFYFKFEEKMAHLIFVENQKGKPVVKKTAKNYLASREEEIFKLLNQGCEIDENAIFEKLIKDIQ